MTRKHAVVVTMTLGMALTLLSGCEAPSADAPNAPKLQVHNNAVESNSTPTRSVTSQQAPPVTEVAPVSHVSYPQHATKHLVPEIWSVPKGDVALTIDDGPSPYTEKIIEVLNRYHVHATFFL